MPSASPYDLSSPLDSERRQKAPRWVPISLLAVSTAALAIPAVLLWRQKKTLAVPQQLARAQNGSSSAPPVRRKSPALVSSAASSSQSPSAALGGPMSAPPRRLRPSVKTAERLTRPATVSEALVSKPNPHPRETGFVFDGPLMSLGAFGLATAAVGASAVLGVWGVQRSLGVNSVDEFAARVRELLRRYLPDLSRRMYRQSTTDDGPLPATSSTLTESSPWSWDEAENRLSEAYEKGGVGTWAVSAMREMEAEQEVERRRRGL